MIQKIAYTNPLRTFNLDNKQNISSSKSLQEVSFKGADEKFYDDLKSLREVHCPICNVKMLSDNEAKELLEKGDSIKSAKEFKDFLKEKEESLLPQFKNIVRYADSALKDEPDLDMDSLLYKMYMKAAKQTKDSVLSGVDTLTNLQKQHTFSDSDNVLIQECKMRMINIVRESKYGRIDFQSYKKALKDTVGALEYSDKWNLYASLKDPVKDSVILLQKFFYSKDSALLGSRQKQLLKNAFAPSYSVIKDIKPSLDTRYDERCNKLLVCSDCASEKSSIYRLFNSPDAGKYFTQYQDDIAKNMIEGKMKGNEDYLDISAGFIKTITKGNIRQERTSAVNALNDKIFQAQRAKIEFLPVTYNGTPCYTCGKETINHEKKCEIFDEIASKKDMHAIKETFIKYNNLIDDMHRPIVRVFKKTLKENPDISQGQMLKQLRASASDDIKKQIEENEDSLKNLSKKYNISPEDREKINKFINGCYLKFYNIEANEQFPFKDYNNFIWQTLSEMDNPMSTEFIACAKESVKEKFMAQSLLYPPDAASKKLHSEVKVIAQDIIRGALGVTDYLIARDKDGDEEISNKGVLCRVCDKKKSNYTFGYWLRLHPEMKINIQKYIDFLAEKSDSGRNEPLVTYLCRFSGFIKSLSKNEIKPHFDLNKKIQT